MTSASDERENAASDTAGERIELLKEAIRRIDKLSLRPIWPKEAHYFSGVCKAGCITELNRMIAEMEDQHIIGGTAYIKGGGDNGV